MPTAELSQYLQYERNDAAAHQDYKWTCYPKKHSISYLHRFLDSETEKFMLACEEVKKYPWLVSLFQTQNLSAYVHSRREHNLETYYVDYMGPGDWNNFDSDIPDKIFAVSLADANPVDDAPQEFLKRTTHVDANVYEVSETVRKLRNNNFPAAHITTETAKGPLWRFMEKDLLDKFQLEMVWEYYAFMFRVAYSLAANDGSVLFIQIPSINSRNSAKLKDQEIDRKILQSLNGMDVPTYINGDMMICVKTEKSPKKLRRRDLGG